ncbi:MAG: hypothetical protein GEU99_18425 [Luteitalea sp.]|nr:hypothetical protein [Luteitalea sp.]
MTRARLLLAAFAFAWIGLLAGIAMEAVVRFDAPGLARPVGLSVGKVVFAAVAGVERVLFAIAVILAFVSRPSRFVRIMLVGIGAVLLLEQAFLLPVLDARADLYIQGRTPPTSSAHALYLAGEAIKVVLLGATGWTLLRGDRSSPDSRTRIPIPES